MRSVKRYCLFTCTIVSVFSFGCAKKESGQQSGREVIHLPSSLEVKHKFYDLATAGLILLNHKLTTQETSDFLKKVYHEVPSSFEEAKNLPLTRIFTISVASFLCQFKEKQTRDCLKTSWNKIQKNFNDYDSSVDNAINGHEAILNLLDKIQLDVSSIEMNTEKQNEASSETQINSLRQELEKRTENDKRYTISDLKLQSVYAFCVALISDHPSIVELLKSLQNEQNSNGSFENFQKIDFAFFKTFHHHWESNFISQSQSHSIYEPLFSRDFKFFIHQLKVEYFLRQSFPEKFELKLKSKEAMGFLKETVFNKVGFAKGIDLLNYKIDASVSSNSDIDTVLTDIVENLKPSNTLRSSYKNLIIAGLKISKANFTTSRSFDASLDLLAQFVSIKSECRLTMIQSRKRILGYVENLKEKDFMLKYLKFLEYELQRESCEISTEKMIQLQKKLTSLAARGLVNDSLLFSPIKRVTYLSFLLLNEKSRYEEYGFDYFDLFVLPRELCVVAGGEEVRRFKDKFLSIDCLNK